MRSLESNSDLVGKFLKEDVGTSLDQLGEKRLLNKKERMKNLLKIAVPDEALYREIMLSLGYKKNKVQFQELAMILPYSEIRKLKNQEIIENALLYRGGLVNSKSGLPKDFDTSLKMKKNVWRYQSVRPPNFPERRIKSISGFFSESCENGIYEFFKQRIQENFTSSVNGRSASQIVNNIVSFEGIGQSRGLEIFFNILLPFYAVIFEKDDKPEFVRFLDELYSHHPPLLDNSITKAMRRKLFKDKNGSDRVTSVRRYMGLIQLYNESAKSGEDDNT
jgi:hypothetical protein